MTSIGTPVPSGSENSGNPGNSGTSEKKKTSKKNQDPWKLQKNISMVFANVLSRTKNDDFLQDSLEYLKDQGVLEEEKIAQAMCEESIEENLKVELSLQVYHGLTSKVFGIPDEDIELKQE